MFLFFSFCVLLHISLNHFNLFSTTPQAKASGFNVIHIITIILGHFIFTKNLCAYLSVSVGKIKIRKIITKRMYDSQMTVS